jgi:hypothetical protein
LWMHQLLRPEAAAIWRELIFVAAQSIPGMTVERVVRRLTYQERHALSVAAAVLSVQADLLSQALEV